MRRRELFEAVGAIALVSIADRAFGQDDATVRDLRQRLADARAFGRLLLIAIEPARDSLRALRQERISALIRDPIARAELATLELACARLRTVQQVARSTGGGEPVFVLVDPSASPMRVVREGAHAAGGNDFDVSELAAMVHRLVMADPDALARRAQIERARLGAAVTDELDRALSSGELAVETAVQAPNAVLHAATSSPHRTELLAALAQVPISLPCNWPVTGIGSILSSQPDGDPCPGCGMAFPGNMKTRKFIRLFSGDR
jgi:hypothetical protein